MWRVLAEPLMCFLAPFVAYGLLLAARSRYPFALAAWPRSTVSVLTLVGLAAAVAGVLSFGALAPRHQGAYVPAHIEHGQLVPGRFQ